MNKRLITVFWADNTQFIFNNRRWQLGKLIILWGGPADLEEQQKKGIFEGVDFFDHEVKKEGSFLNKDLVDVYTVYYKNPYRKPKTARFTRKSKDEKKDGDEIWTSYEQTQSACKLETKLYKAAFDG